MKFSENWIKEWVPIDVNLPALTHQLTMAGLEVDGVEPVAPAFNGVVVGEVTAVNKHDNADTLQVCSVNVGDETLQIVCGAKNVHAGMKVPTALVGATLPSDFHIKKAKLRGVTSFGMLCAASELGLTEQTEGLLALPTDAPVGMDFRQFLTLDDNSIAVDLTPNRGDCLSIRGVAREIGVLYKLPVTEPNIRKISPSITETFPITVQAKQACPHYLGRIIRGVDPHAQTPLWMREKLRRSGLRSLGPLVDVTNYVMLEYGQPLHAFDLQKLHNSITVRMAQPGETILLLDGQEKILDVQTLVIADQQGPIAIAGIMGGQRTAVSDATQHILLECAFFAPLAIAGRSRGYALHTDASHRFERGVDWRLQEQAMQRATALIQEIAGGDVAPITTLCAQAELPTVKTIPLRAHKIRQTLGLAIAPTTVTEILTRLGMGVTQTNDEWSVTTPSYRFDLDIEADLIEEIGRIYGYDNLPTAQIHTPMGLHAIPESKIDLMRMKRLLVERGYQEVVTYSFVNPETQQLVEPQRTAIPLSNPLSQEMSVMRTSLWTGLLQTMQYNRKRQQSRIRIFETGLRFYQDNNEIQQDNRLAGLVTGSDNTEQWGQKSQPIDFYDVKSDVMSLLALTGQACAFSFKKATHPALHPGQTARIYRENQAVGWLGLIHPKLQQTLALGQKVFVFDLCVQEISNGRLPAFQPLSKYPSVRRDIAIIVEESVRYSQVSAIIKNNQNSHLKEAILFDVYRGENLGEKQKSMAIGLILQEDTRTLTDDEVDLSVNEIVKMLSEKLGATLRD